MEWNVPNNLTRPDDLWALWQADQSVFAVIGLVEGAERSGGTVKSVFVSGSCNSPSPVVAALALLVWDILTTMDEEVRVPGGERIDGRLTDSSCQGEADLAVRPSSLFKYHLSSCPLRSSWTVPKFLYFFVRYYSLITLMCVRTKHVQRARL